MSKAKGKSAGTGADGAAKVRKSTKGIPRITNKVLAGGEALEGYKAAVAKLSATVQAECMARLEVAQKAGPKVKVSSAARLQKVVDKLTIKANEINAKLIMAQDALKAAQEKVALEAIEGITEQERIIEKANKVLADLKAKAALKAANAEAVQS
jgi:hypothetical protein